MDRRSRTRSNGKFREACDVGFEGARRLEKMPIREFRCPEHGVFEQIFTGQFDQTYAKCPFEVGGEMMDGIRRVWACGIECPLVEFSVPAKRNSRYGEQT